MKKNNEDTYKKNQDLYEVPYMKEVQEVLAATNKKQKKDQAVQAATVKSNKSLNIAQQKEMMMI